MTIDKKKDPAPQQHWPTTCLVSQAEPGELRANSIIAVDTSNLRYQSILVPLIEAIRNSHPDMQKLYMEGQCYNFHLIIKSLFPEAECYYNQIEGHILTRLGGEYYDIRGMMEELPEGYEPFDKTGITDHPSNWGKRDTRRLTHSGGEVVDANWLLSGDMGGRDTIDMSKVRYVHGKMESFLKNYDSEYHIRPGSPVLALMLGQGLRELGADVVYVQIFDEDSCDVMVNWNNVFFDYHHGDFDAVVQSPFWSEQKEVLVLNEEVTSRQHTTGFDYDLFPGMILSEWKLILEEFPESI